ncbi:MAG TPA: hypothetical protein VFE47_03785 [Tepidisphaeraceae bacterium]|jgi:hypothetical protein|nr:hypothetical protein [Tepidisphaeraceae bacterium]
MNLITDENFLKKFVDPDGEAVRALREQIDAEMFDDPICGSYLRWYLVFTKLPGALSAIRLSNEEIFWNRYY